MRCKAVSHFANGDECDCQQQALKGSRYCFYHHQMAGKRLEPVWNDNQVYAGKTDTALERVCDGKRELARRPRCEAFVS